MDCHRRTDGGGGRARAPIRSRWCHLLIHVSLLCTAPGKCQPCFHVLSWSKLNGINELRSGHDFALCQACSKCFIPPGHYSRSGLKAVPTWDDCVGYPRCLDRQPPKKAYPSPEQVNGTLLGERIFAGVIKYLVMRSFWIIWLLLPPSSMNGESEKGEHTDIEEGTQRRPLCDDRERDRTGRGMDTQAREGPKIAAATRREERSLGGNQACQHLGLDDSPPEP